MNTNNQKSTSCFQNVNIICSALLCSALLCSALLCSCLLYTSDAADDMQCVDLGGRRIIKKNFFKQKTAYEISECLVGSEMCIRDRVSVTELLMCERIPQDNKLNPERVEDIVKAAIALSLIHI